MIGEEADGVNDDMCRRPALSTPKMVEDIGLEPGILRPSAAALVDQAVAVRGNAQLKGDETTGFLKLLFVAAVVGHRRSECCGP